MPITFDQFAYAAYRAANLTQTVGTGLGPDETEEVRTLYNRMIDAFRADGFTVRHIERTLFPVIDGQSDYTIGPSADWDTPLTPEHVERMSLILTDQTLEPEYPLRMLTQDEYQQWVYKHEVANYPWCAFYEKAWPLGIVHLLYVPTLVNQAAVYLENALGIIDDTGNQALDWPPGYEEMLTLQVAIRIPGGKPSADTKRMAAESLSMVKANNNRPLSRTTDLARWRGRSAVLLGNRWGW